jgi:hypothetical protein
MCVCACIYTYINKNTLDDRISHYIVPSNFRPDDLIPHYILPSNFNLDDLFPDYILQRIFTLDDPISHYMLPAHFRLDDPIPHYSLQSNFTCDDPILSSMFRAPFFHSSTDLDPASKYCTRPGLKAAPIARGTQN